MGEEKAIRIKNSTILTKTAYEHLEASVGKMLEEGKIAGLRVAVARLDYKYKYKKVLNSQNNRK